MIAIIYKIENLKTSDCYIGSTTRFSKRKTQHLKAAKTNKHHSIIFQRAWNKYGESCFRFFILEKFISNTKEEILVREQFYIDLIKPKYNICKIAGSQLGLKRTDEFRKSCSDRMKGNIPWNKDLLLPPHSEETKRKMSDKKLGIKLSAESVLKIKNAVSKPIQQFDKDGNFIKTWNSAKEACLFLGFSYPRLSEYLSGKSNIGTFKNFIWKRI